MKPKVVLYKTIPDQELAQLNNHFEVTLFNGVNGNNKDAFFAAIESADGIIGSGVTIPNAVIDRASNLKAAATISVGTDHFDLTYLANRGIPLIHTPGVLNETVADTVILLALGAARRAAELSIMVREGKWLKNLTEERFGVDLHGKTMGIVGMGRIGCAVAKRAHHGFGMSICYYNRSANSEAEQEFNAERLPLDQLLQKSDFVVMLVPLSAETEQMIGKKELDQMKSSAIFVNAARGKVVDEQALIEALQQGVIRGAGLDVFEVEPLPSSSPLTQLDNAFLLPHIGSATAETRLSMVQCAVEGFIAAMHGDYSKSCANAHLLNQ